MTPQLQNRFLEKPIKATVNDKDINITGLISN